MTLMKKAKTGKHKAGKGTGAAKKTAPKTGTAKTRWSTTVKEYLAGVPQATENHFDQLRAAVLSVVPAEATETISYGIPAIRHGKVVVWYAAFAKHCSLFPTAAVIEEFKSELTGYTTSKGTIQFPIDKPLPVALVKKIVKARLARVGRTKKQ
jgi:uncharacterized protein YdhG (YjbR/CyaY superfamily)